MVVSLNSRLESNKEEDEEASGWRLLTAHPDTTVGLHVEKLTIYKIGSMKFTTHNDLY